MYIVETRNLTKRFNGLAAVDNLNLRVEKGSVFGFLGPNGAGKTTTMRMLLGFATPTSGEAIILGEKVGGKSAQYKKSIGFLPDVPAFYNWMTGPEYLRFSGELAGLRGKELTARTGHLLDAAGLGNVKTKIGGYSRGMKQRLGLAQALITSPEIVFMDEPTSALDPIGRKEVLEMISTIAEDTTVLLSTHILTDVERVCDTVAVLNKGRLVVQKPIAELKREYIVPAIKLTVKAGAEKAEEVINTLEWVGDIERQEQSLRITVKDLDAAQTQLPRIVSDLGLGLVHFENVETTLEDIFVRLVTSDEH